MAQHTLDAVLRRISAMTEELNNEEYIEEESFPATEAAPQLQQQTAEGQYSTKFSSEPNIASGEFFSEIVQSQQVPAGTYSEIPATAPAARNGNTTQQAMSSIDLKQLQQQPLQKEQKPQHEGPSKQQDSKRVHCHQQDTAEQLTQGYLKALHGGRLSPLTATAAAAAGATQHHDTTAAARQQHSSSSSSNRRSSSASPARANRPVAATVFKKAAQPTKTKAVHSRTRGLLTRALQQQLDRTGMPSLQTERRTFPAADRYEGSYLEAFAKTIHSPGPIYYPGCNCCGASRAGSTTAAAKPGGSSNGGGGGSSDVAKLVMTARCAHSASGTWNKADVGSRELLLVHTCRCCKSSQQQQQHLTSAAVGQCFYEPGRQHLHSSSSSSSSDCTACTACTAAAWAVPGPRSYDFTVGKDGRGVLLTQSCPAFSVPRAGRLVSGRRAPYISAHHAQRENQGACSPGPVYRPALDAVRPSSCSPTMQGRGSNHWEQVASTGRASSARQILGHSPISRTSVHLWGDAPRTHFDTAPVDRWPGTFISERHSAVANVFRYGAEPHYHPRYDQVDGHVAQVFTAAGQEDPFDDKWLPGAGRLQ